MTFFVALGSSDSHVKSKVCFTVSDVGGQSPTHNGGRGLDAPVHGHD